MVVLPRLNPFSTVRPPAIEKLPGRDRSTTLFLYHARSYHKVWAKRNARRGAEGLAR